MNCEQAGPLLVDYQRDELAAAERLALAAHLQLCEHCSAELTAMLQMSQLLDLEQQVSPAARERFLKELQRQTGNRHSVRTTGAVVVAWFQRVWPARPLGALSYSAALLIVGLLSGQLLPPHALGVGPVDAQKSERVIQLCPVPPAPTVL